MNISKLESLLDDDQLSIREFRQGRISLEELSARNRHNVEFLSETIDAEGFPFKDVVSEKAYDGAILVALHANDVLFMERCLELLSKASDRQRKRRDVAYLTDKIRVLKGLPQVYGTQYQILSDGEIRFFPIEDEKSVDARRGEMGMESLEEYRRFAEGQ